MSLLATLLSIVIILLNKFVHFFLQAYVKCKLFCVNIFCTDSETTLTFSVAHQFFLTVIV